MKKKGRANVGERQELYGTKQVAKILGIPEWRVKNFSEGAAYRLPPALQVGSGHGSRRLYGSEDIYRLGIANTLVNFGFTPESVGAAVREIPESKLGPYPEYEGKLKRKETPLLVKRGGARFEAVWQLVMASKVQSEWTQTVEHGGGDQGLFVLNIANVCNSIYGELERYRTGETPRSETIR